MKIKVDNEQVEVISMIAIVSFPGGIGAAYKHKGQWIEIPGRFDNINSALLNTVIYETRTNEKRMKE